MKIIDNAIILLLIAVAFWLGKRISDSYHEKHEAELQFLIRLNAAQNGVGYVVPPQRKKYMPIGQPFMDRLKENGRATQQISPEK